MGPQHSDQAPNKPAGVQEVLGSISKELPCWERKLRQRLGVGYGWELAGSECPELTSIFPDYKSKTLLHTHSQKFLLGRLGKEEAGKRRQQRRSQTGVQRSKKKLPLNIVGAVLETSASPLH